MRTVKHPRSGDWADHVSGELDPREVTRVRGDQIWLRIGGESGPYPAANYTFKRDMRAARRVAPLFVPNVSHPTDRPNFYVVAVDDAKTGGILRFWYSYETLIAVTGPQTSIVRVNRWATTTGKHLNHVDGGGKAAKDARLSTVQFIAALAALGYQA